MASDSSNSSSDKPRTAGKPPRKVTQKDVAAAADVSQALVSLVFSDSSSSDDISESSRRKIIEAAQQLGYQKRKKEVQVKKSRKVLAYIYPEVKRGHHEEHWLYDSYEDFYMRIQRPLQEAAQAHGYSLMAYCDSDSAQLTQWLSEWEVEGVFWRGRDPKFAEWINLRFPLVQVGRRMIAHADTVLVNQEESAEIALEHLHSKGHTRIAFLPRAHHYDDLDKRRIYAYRSFMEGIGVEPVLLKPLFSRLTLTLESIHAAIDLLTSDSPDRPTALIASDGHALYIQKRLLMAGLSLPGDFSIVGIDNISAGNFSHPALTSVDDQHDAVAMGAISLMQHRIVNPKAPYQKLEVTPQLVERESVGAPSRLKASANP